MESYDGISEDKETGINGNQHVNAYDGERKTNNLFVGEEVFQREINQC